MTKQTKILVVDDSAFMRKAITQMVSDDPALTVIGTASNGKECIEKVAELKPDIVTLDVDMPVMNGLDALAIIMKKTPLPVIMLSSQTEEEAKATFDAFELGAVDFIAKNLDDISVNIIKIKNVLLSKLKAIAQKPYRHFLNNKYPIKKDSSSGITPSENGSKENFIAPLRSRKRIIDLVTIGSSTGGPHALKNILSHLPSDLPVPILIVQHMPAVFIKQFAYRLNETCPLDVKEAEKGEPIEARKVLIAPGGIHTVVRKGSKGKVAIHLTTSPGDIIHKPSADQMMSSAAKVLKNKTMGVILTGMGNDGLKGMSDIKAQKGITIAQNEKSCVIYGMPKAVVEAGVADFILSLDTISMGICNYIYEKSNT